jgi:hypothetical protein
MPTKPTIEEQRLAAKKEPADTVAYWRRAAERLRPYEDAVIAFSEIPVSYLTVLGAAEYLARHGLRRGESARYWQHPAARALVDAEKRAMARRGKQLLEKLDALVGESMDEPGGWQPVANEKPGRAHSARSRQANVDPDMPPQGEAEAA